MELLKLIFYKIYCWQRRFGSGYTLLDTVLGITALCYILVGGFFFNLAYFFGRESLNFLDKFSDASLFINGIGLGILANIFLMMILLNHKRYFKILLQMHRKYRGKYKWLVLSLILGSYLYLGIAMYIAVKKNVI